MKDGLFLWVDRPISGPRWILKGFLRGFQTGIAEMGVSSFKGTLSWILCNEQKAKHQFLGSPDFEACPDVFFFFLCVCV